DTRARASSAPALAAGVTARGDANRWLSVRGSAGGSYGAPSYPLAATNGLAPGRFVDQTASEYAGLRLEHSNRFVHLTADLFYQHRDYFVPPSEDAGATLQ